MALTGCIKNGELRLCFWKQQRKFNFECFQLVIILLCSIPWNETVIGFLKLTNHTVGGDGGISKPALGESWKGIPHVRLLLSRDHGGSICNVSILKHPSMVQSLASLFSMCAQSYHSSVWPLPFYQTALTSYGVSLFHSPFFFSQATGKAARFMIHES